DTFLLLYHQHSRVLLQLHQNLVFCSCSNIIYLGYEACMNLSASKHTTYQGSCFAVGSTAMDANAAQASCEPDGYLAIVPTFHLLFHLANTLAIVILFILTTYSLLIQMIDVIC